MRRLTPRKITFIQGGKVDIGPARQVRNCGTHCFATLRGDTKTSHTSLR
jgi:N6-adenosine-specific RNA methylase IME4